MDWAEFERRIASGEDLRAKLSDLGFHLNEHQFLPLTGAGDLDLRAFGRFLQARGFRANHESPPISEATLSDAGVLCDFGEERHATLYGVLAFGRTPQAHALTRNFLIRCAAYDGDDRNSGVLLVSEAAGRLDEQVRRALGWFRSLPSREGREGVGGETAPRLPPEALREALVNAVAHRDYAISDSPIRLEVFADRAEVTSPGPLPYGRFVEGVKAGGGPRSRNESMANFLVEAGLKGGRGRGFLAIRKAMRNFNGTEPDLVNDHDGGFVRVTLHFDGPEPLPGS